MSVVHWAGGATAVKDKWTITVANTWAAADLANVTVGNKTLILTIGSTATTAQVATELAQAINNTALDTPTPLGTAYTSNFVGQQFPEFQEFVATVVGSTVVLTGATAGIPFTPSVSETTAGSGTLAIAHTTSATGPNFLSNPDNYVGGAVGVDNDTIKFDTDLASGGVDCLYDLDFYSTGNIDLNWVFSNDWTGAFGLPPQNANGYAEYRRRYGIIRGGAKVVSIVPGLLGNVECGNLWLDSGVNVGQTWQIEAARNLTSGVPSIYISGCSSGGAHTSVTIKANAGNIVFEPPDAPNAAADGFYAQQWFIGEAGGQDSGTIVTLGQNTRFTEIDDLPVTLFSGTVYCDAPTYSTNTTDVELTVAGGVWINREGGDIGKIKVEAAGTYRHNSAFSVFQNETVEVFGGTYDLSQCHTYALSASRLKIYANSSLKCPTYIGLTEIDFVGCRIADCPGTTLPPNRIVDLSTAAS